jgi:hypothetical protein
MIKMCIKTVENLVEEFNTGQISEENFYKALQNTAKMGLDNVRQHKIWNMKDELRPGSMVFVDHKRVAGRQFRVKEVKRVKVIVVNPDNEHESFIVPLSLVKKA